VTFAAAHAGPFDDVTAQSASAAVMTRMLQLVLAMWAFTLIFHELPVGGRWMPVGGLVWFALIGWVLTFAGAYLTVGRLRALKAGQRALYPGAAGYIALIVMAISALGAALVIFDFAFLRGYGFDTSASLIRTLETEAAMKGLSTSSGVSGIGRLALPAAFPAIILLCANPGSLNRLQKIIFGVMLLILLYEQLFFEGGRFFLTAMAAIIAIVTFIRIRVSNGGGGFKLSPRLVLASVVGGSALLIFFGYVFVSRIAERDDFFWSAYRGFTTAFAINVDVDIIARFEGFFGSAWFSLSMLWIYLTQGINEFDQILQLDHFNHANSLYQFPHFGQIAQITAGIEWRYDLAANLPNLGTYLTMPGANYVDYGMTGMFLSALILGGATAISLKAFINRSRSGLALCGPILITIAIFSPVVSLVTTLWPAFFWSFVTSGLVTIFERR
jgi:hypothetical protein